MIEEFTGACTRIGRRLAVSSRLVIRYCPIRTRGSSLIYACAYDPCSVSCWSGVAVVHVFASFGELSLVLFGREEWFVLAGRVDSGILSWLSWGKDVRHRPNDNEKDEGVGYGGAGGMRTAGDESERELELSSERVFVQCCYLFGRLYYCESMLCCATTSASLHFTSLAPAPDQYQHH